MQAEFERVIEITRREAILEISRRGGAFDSRVYSEMNICVVTN